MRTKDTGTIDTRFQSFANVLLSVHQEQSEVQAKIANKQLESTLSTLQLCWKDYCKLGTKDDNGLSSDNVS